jgi:hypothetical protein
MLKRLISSAREAGVAGLEAIYPNIQRRKGSIYALSPANTA